ncbi:glycosyltransferase family 4 protein [Marinobacter sp. SS21]|uniref:glycosyltransferase family 4 protein n=1 Tax=Marinobacter sp. SS21 TaxID=2979460 RepID=UPI002330232F|nr:glycosyltransferase family 4 protein [Marinobacter sp. SS21]MDC0661950.1 glycosyltransferase family 4 protein [Marinobacter sp. SS21]
MTNILHLIDTTGPGGAETVFVNLLAGLDRRKFNHIVVLRGEGWVADQVRGVGIEPIIIDSKGSFNVRYVLTLVKLVRSHGVRLIHSHLLGSNVYGAIAALLSRTPLVATFHGNVDVAARERFLATKFRLINSGASSIVCVSQQLMADLTARGTLSSQKLRLIYNGVDADGFLHSGLTGLREELGLAPEARIILSIGNIRPAKGYGDLIKAAALLVRRDPSYHFVIVGHPKEPLASQLVEQARDLVVEANVHFLGFRENVGELLSQADVFLLPSISEGFSISTVEAMMAGVPVLATRSGGPEEILENDVSGLLVPVANPQAIMDSVLRLQDPCLSNQLVKAAREAAAQRFSLGSMLSSYCSVYQELLV